MERVTECPRFKKIFSLWLRRSLQVFLNCDIVEIDTIFHLLSLIFSNMPNLPIKNKPPQFSIH